jgi:glucose-1-phosphate cytidylyltransferase
MRDALKAVILAGGLGSRLAEETEVRPKPMVEIGGRPIIWHIMKIYSAHGINDFIVCLGYKGYLIKEYFANYGLHMADVTIDLVERQTVTHNTYAEPWRVTLVDTGERSQTGGRLKRVRNYINDEDFCFTYGDGLSSVDVRSLVAFHKSHNRLATVTAVMPPGRFGSIEIDNGIVMNFLEKPRGDGNWINGGFFVLKPQCMEFIDDDLSVWEGEPLNRLVEEQQLAAYAHTGFWQAMDTLRDKYYLEKLWASGEAPWKIW